MPPHIKAPLVPCPCSKPHISLSRSSARLFASRVTTTTSSTKGQIPPESPRFISIPKPVQEKAVYHPYVKGFLPVPRQIFPKKLQKDKTSTEYLQAVTPDPLKPKLSTSNRPTHPLTAYKAKQAAHRRQNLRESLIELHARKKHLDHQVASRSAYIHKTNQRLLFAPPLDSERLTAPSVPLAMRPLSRMPLQDPDRAERIAEKRANTALKQVEREEDRRNMLHTLYVNAPSFITTPEQLDKEVDRVFDDKEQFRNDSEYGENIWNTGYPETVLQLLSRKNGEKTIDQSGEVTTLAQQRLTRLAEELTGGKM